MGAVTATIRNALKFGSLLIVVGFAAGGVWFFVTQVDREVGVRVRTLLCEHYSDYKVRVGSARRVEGKGIEIRNISISDPEMKGTEAELLHIEEIMLGCNTNLIDLVQNQLSPRCVNIRGLTLRPTRQRDGAWNIAGLWPLPKQKEDSPLVPVTVERARIEIRDRNNDSVECFELRDIFLQMTPQASPTATNTAAKEINNPNTQAQAGTEQPNPPEPTGCCPTESGPSVLTMQCRFSGNYIRRAELSGVFDPLNKSWSLSGAINGIAIRPELRRGLPYNLPRELRLLDSLRGEASYQIQISGKGADLKNCRYYASGKLTSGRIDDPRLPYSISDVTARVTLNNHGFRIENLHGKSGQATLQASIRGEGFTPQSPIEITATARHLQLGREMASLLPDSAKKMWSKTLPEGVIDAKIHAKYDGQRWQPNIDILCQDVSFEYEAFPYRLVKGAGSLTLKDNILEAKLWAVANEQAVRIESRLDNPGPDFTGWFLVEANDPVAIDDRLLRAFTPKVQAVFRELNPRGAIRTRAKFVRQVPGGPLRSHILAEMVNGSIRYDKFPYPIEGVTGIIEGVDQDWSFRNFKGHNDSGKITCQGSWRIVPVMLEEPSDPGSLARSVYDRSPYPVQQAGYHQVDRLPQPARSSEGVLELHFTATDVALEDELRDALNEGSRVVWNKMQLRGAVDHMRIKVLYGTSDNRLSCNVAAQKWPGSRNVEGRDISINPSWLPYRLDHLTGDFHYNDGQVTFRNVRGRHNDTQVSLDGSGWTKKDGSWGVKFQRLSVDRLHADRDLMMALPDGLRNAVQGIGITGLMHLQGAVDLTSDAPTPLTDEYAAVPGPVRARWDINFDIEDGTVGRYVKLENVHGSMRLKGESLADQYEGLGALQVDSLMCKGFQFTNVRGPIRFNTREVAFGTWARARNSKDARNLTARVLGGQFKGDGRVLMTPDRPFTIECSFAEADLRRFAQERIAQDILMSGKANGAIQLRGNCNGSHTWRGGGMIRLHDADIYELPLMAQMLKILTIKQPDSTAFTTAKIDFRLDGDHLYFNQIDFNGDVISLSGKGQMDLDRKLDMEFGTVVGRNELALPVLGPVWREAGRQLMKIHVGGTLDNPKMTRTVLPLLNDTIRAPLAESLTERREGIRDASKTDPPEEENKSWGLGLGWPLR